MPLNEDAELYDVELYDGPGGALLLTFTDLTAETATYTAAQITADGFGAPPDPLTLKVFQKSAQVGRGFSLEKTIPTT